MHALQFIAYSYQTGSSDEGGARPLRHCNQCVYDRGDSYCCYKANAMNNPNDICGRRIAYDDNELHSKYDSLHNQIFLYIGNIGVRYFINLNVTYSCLTQYTTSSLHNISCKPNIFNKVL